MMKRFLQILLLALSLGLIALPGNAQEIKPAPYRQPVVHGSAQAQFAGWRVVLVFRGGRWHRDRYWVYDRPYPPYYPSWKVRRDYWQARRWRWEHHRAVVLEARRWRQDPYRARGQAQRWRWDHARHRWER